MKRLLLAVLLAIPFIIAAKPLIPGFLSSEVPFDIYVFIIIVSFSLMISYRFVYYLSKLKLEEKHSRIDIAFVGFFFAILFVPMFRISNEEVSLRENRTLAKRSPLFVNGMVNSEYGRQFDAWFNDRFFGRTSIIRRYEDIKFFLSSQRENINAFEGKDGWLFIKRDGSMNNFRNATLFSDNQLEKIGGYLMSVDNWAKKNNKRFYFLIAPEKSKIYGEYYKEIPKERPDSESRANQLVRWLGQNTPVRAVYPYDALMAHKPDGRLLYFKTDSHWNQLGAFYAYRELMKEVGKDFKIPVFSFAKFKETKFEKGDLVGILSASDVIKDDTVYYVPDYKPFGTCEISALPDKVREERCTGKGDHHIFMFHDSFGQDIMPYMMRGFKEGLFYWNYQIDKQVLVRINDFDIIVLQIAERFLPRLESLSFPEEK